MARARSSDRTTKTASPARGKRKASAAAGTGTGSRAARAYHHGALRAALLEGARSELHEVGWLALSLRSVARRAGVTHTAAYHHFADKNALLADVAVEGFQLLDRRMAEAMDAAGADPVDRLMAAAHGYIRMAAEDPAAYDLMFNGCDTDVSAELQRTGAEPFRRLVAAVKAARDSAGITDDRLLDEAMLHWEVVHGLATLYRTGKHTWLGLDLEAHTRFVTEKLRAFYGPAARGGRSPRPDDGRDAS